MADISQQMNLVESTPEQAAEHIDNANVFNITPDVYKQNKAELEPEIHALQRPKEASETVSRYIAEDPEKAALAAPDVDILSSMERSVRSVADRLGQRQTTQQKIIDLNLKKMFETDKYTEDDELELFKYTEDSKDFANDGFAMEVASGFVSMGSALSKHAALIAGATAAGAALGIPAGPPGIIGGAAAGAINSSLISLSADGVMSQMGSIHNELSNMTDDNGEPLNIDPEMKRNVSVGVGIATGVITGIVGKATANSIPFVKNILGGKGLRAVIMNPGSEALRQTLFNVGKSVTAGSGGAGIQRATEIMGKEFAKTFDGSEASYMAALQNASGEIASAMAVGGVTTGIISGTGNAVGYKNFRNQFIAAEEARFGNARPANPDLPLQINDITPQRPRGGGPARPVSPVDNAIQVLEFDNMVDHVVKESKKTNMQKVSPQQLGALRQKMMKDSGVAEVYLDKEDMQKFATDEKKGEAVRNIIDDSGTLAAANNAPMRVDAHKFIEAVEQYPDFAEYARLHPETPAVHQAVKMLDDYTKVQGQRKELMAKLGASETTPEDRIMIEQALATEQPSLVYPRDTEVFGEDAYLDLTRTKAAVDVFMPKEQSKNYIEAQLAARQSVVDNINETAKYEMDQIIDQVTDEAMSAEFTNQLARLESNPNVALVDRFTKTYQMKPDQRFTNVNEMTLNHAKKGYSPLAIDPRSLTAEQAQVWLGNEQLQKHKAFVKGGISANDSARLVGAKDADELFKIMSQTPSREEIALMRVEARKGDIERLSRESVDLNETAIAKAYNSHLANAVATLNHMKDHEWTAMKGGIKKIAQRPVSVKGITAEAKIAVMKMKIGELNVNQFKVGERKSNRLAVDAILENKPERAFVNQKAVASNIALANQVHQAIGKSNRVLRFAKKMRSAENQQILKDAGPVFEKAYAEIVDVYNLDLSKKNQAKRDQFVKWVKEMKDTAEGDFSIPDKFSEIKESVRDMSVEELLLVGDRLKSILHQAKMKNRLYEKFENLKMIQTIEGMASGLAEFAQDHVDYDVKKGFVNQSESKSMTEVWADRLLKADLVLTRPEALILKFDKEQINGPLWQIAYKPIKQGEAARGEQMIKVQKEFKAKIAEYGEKEFAKLHSTIVKVPEFESIPTLRNGMVTKFELMMMLQNMGNEGNISRLENYGLTREVFKTVLERELDHKEMKFVQEAIWNMYESFKPQVAALQLKTEGTETRFVEAVPLEFKGRVYPGGYAPIKYMNDANIKSTRENLAGRLEINKIDKLTQNLYANAMTDQGYLEERTGSKKVLSLSLSQIGQGFEEVVHDIHMRVPVRDSYKILSNESIANTVSSVLGIRGYSALADMVVDASESVQMRNNSSADQTVLSWLNHANSGFQSVAIVGKLSSIVVQPASLFFSIDKMGGVQGLKHTGIVVKKILSNPGKIGEFFDLASDLHAPILETRENLDQHAANSINRLLPSAPVIVGGKNMSGLKRGLDWANELGYSTLGQVDQLNKTIVVLSAYSQAISGDAAGIPAGDHQAAKDYAGSIARMTQTHGGTTDIAPIQKTQYARPFLMFYNDANNVYQSTRAAMRKAANAGNETYDKAKSGDIGGAAKAAGAGIAGVMGYMLILAASKQYEDMMRAVTATDDKDFKDKLKKGAGVFWSDDKRTPEQFAADAGAFFLDSSTDRVLGTVPLIRDVKYAAEKYWQKKKTVELPLDKMLGDFATGAVGLSHMLQFWDKSKTVSDQEWKALLYSTGYLAKYPADAVYKYLASEKSMGRKAFKSTYQTLSNQITKFLKDHKGDASIPQEFKDDLVQTQLQIQPQDQTASVPADSSAVIKQIASGGKWNKLSDTGAAGPYQFTESVWNNIRDEAPELGLTENGRLSSNPEQQERAFKYTNEKNAAFLDAAGIKPSTENLYAAHILGFSDAIKVLTAASDTKLKAVIGEDAMKRNDFKNSMRVRDFEEMIVQKSLQAQEELTVDKETKQ